MIWVFWESYPRHKKLSLAFVLLLLWYTFVVLWQLLWCCFCLHLVDSVACQWYAGGAVAIVECLFLVDDELAVAMMTTTNHNPFEE